MILPGFFIARYPIINAGSATANKISTTVSVKSEVFMVANAYNPKPNEIATITKVVIFALLLVEIPPSKIPAAVKINPINMVKPVNACIPSMNVCAIPAYESMRPANPTPVRPIPGINKSQLLIKISW